jgi:hypothetical protein
VLHVVLHEPGHHGDVGLVHPRDLDRDDDLSLSRLWIRDLADAPRFAERLDRKRAHGFPSTDSTARVVAGGTRR